MAGERIADPVWDARLSAWVTASRQAQGLPSTVEDPDTIEQVAAIFRDARRSNSHKTEAAS